MVIRIARFRLGRDVEGLSMRSSVRRRGRGVWELTVDVGRDAEGKRVRQFRTVRGTKAEAERVLNEMLRVAEFSQGLTSSRMLLGEFMERWLEGRMYPRLRSQTCVLYPREVRLRLGPELGNIPLHRLTTRDLSEMEYRLSKGGARVLQTCRRVLSIVLNHALKLGLIGRNPLVGLDAVGYRRKQPMMPDVESVSGPLAHLRENEPEFHALCHVLAYTGMRMSEVLALRWGNVILDGAFLQVLRSLGRARGGGAEVTPPKSRAGRRRIELDADTVEVLRAHRKRQLDRRERAGRVLAGPGFGVHQRCGLVYVHGGDPQKAGPAG